MSNKTKRKGAAIKFRRGTRKKRPFQGGGGINVEELKELNNATKKLSNNSEPLDLLLIIQSRVTGRTFKFLYTNQNDESKYPLINFKFPENGLYPESIGTDEDYWSKIPEWQELSSNLAKKLEELFPADTLVKIPNPKKNDPLEFLEISSYRLESLKNLDIPKKKYDSIFKASPFKFIIVPRSFLNTYDELFENRDDFKNKFFVVANVYLNATETTQEAFEKKKSKKNIELQQEKIEMDKMSEHEKNIYIILKKTRKGVTNTCKYHLEELKIILSGFQGDTKFEIRRDKLKVDKVDDEAAEETKKVEEEKIKKDAILKSQEIKTSLLTFFREYKESSKLSETNNLEESKLSETNDITRTNNIKKAIEQINEINPTDNKTYVGKNRDILLYQYYRTLINELTKVMNSLKNAKKHEIEMGVLQFSDGKFMFNDFYHPDDDDIKNIQDAINQFKGVMPKITTQGGRKTRKNRKNY